MLMGMHMKQAVANSLTIIALTSLIGFEASRGLINFHDISLLIFTFVQFQACCLVSNLMIFASNTYCKKYSLVY